MASKIPKTIADGRRGGEGVLTNGEVIGKAVQLMDRKRNECKPGRQYIVIVADFEFVPDELSDTGDAIERGLEALRERGGADIVASWVE